MLGFLMFSGKLKLTLGREELTWSINEASRLKEGQKFT